MATLSGNPNGLEVLMTVASCAQSLLGPHRTLKCIVEDDSDPEGSVLVSTAPELLSNLNIDHPVGQLLNSACQSHHRTFGTGSTTLVCMAGFLARAARHCVRMGVPVSAVCHCLEEGVRLCCEEVEKTAMAVDRDVYHKSTGTVRESARTEFQADVSPVASVEKMGSTFTTGDHQECENYSDDVDDISWYFDSEPETIMPFSSTHNHTLHAKYVDTTRTDGTDSLQKSLEERNRESDVLPTDDDDDEFAACFEEIPSQSSSKAGYHEKTIHKESAVTGPSRKSDMTREGFEQLLENKLKESRDSRKLQIRSRHLGLVDFLPSESNPLLQLEDLDPHISSKKVDDYPKQSELPKAKEKSSGLTRLSQGLSHGRHVEMQLACEVFQQILEERQEEVLPVDIDKTHANTCLVSGLGHKHSCVADGIVVKVGADQLTSIVRGKNKQRNILIINGDITENFHHKGYKKALEVSSVTYGARYGSYKVPKSWLGRVRKVILDCDVGLLVAKGIVDQDVMDVCMSVNCVVVQEVKYSTLQTLADATGANILTYVHRTLSQDVGAVTSVGLLEDHSFQSDKGAQVLIKIGTPGRTWSVVLCSLTKAELHDVEQHFWSCLNRLENVLSERKVLPGGGSPELTCIRCLRDTTGVDLPLASFHPRSWLSSCFHQFRLVVFSSLAESFEQYLLSVMVNSGQFSSLHHARAELESLLEGKQENNVSSERVLDRTSKTASNELESFSLHQPVSVCINQSTMREMPMKEDARLYLGGKVGTQFLPKPVEEGKPEESRSEMQTSSECCGSLSMDAGTDIDGEVLDCMCKLEAWRSAASLVQLVLRTDAEIINGAEDDFYKVL
ncbi:Bardet-Biedl syndrome 12 protein-like [Branchiostoma lanceolatum]|uniref:Bardet-Biedl syndrome 12 protein-like n=1 Tax=Branchiostoma lanceolatum TaxID=7740 RepID=UPI003451D450